MELLPLAIAAAVIYVVADLLHHYRQRVADYYHRRALQVHQLRLAYDKAQRMTIDVTDANRQMTLAYMSRVEAEAFRLQLTDLYPTGGLIRSALFNNRRLRCV